MKTKITFFFIGIVSCLVVLYLYANYVDVPDNMTIPEVVEHEQPNNKIVPAQLSLPLSYFTKENLRGGSVNPEKDTDDFTTWKKAEFDGGYRSFPTKTITFSDYSNETDTLPSIPTDNTWQTELPDSVFSETLKNQAIETQLGAQLASAGLHIVEVQNTDVTGDGNPETIVSVDTGGNHPPIGYYIIQGENIIFSGGFGTILLSGLVPSPDGNGFSLNWVADKHLEGRGLCCALGYTSTRFVFENGEFIPVYEQDNRYFEVENTN